MTAEPLAPSGSVAAAAAAPTVAIGAEPVGRQAARQGAIGLIGSLCAGLGGLVLTVTVGRMLDKHSAGVYFTVVALFTIATTVLTLGADTGLVRGLARLQAQGRTAAQRRLVTIAVRPVLVFAVGTVLFVEIFAGRLAAAGVNDELAPQLALAVRLVAPALVLAALTQVLLNGAARGLGSLRSFTLIQQILLPAARPVLIAVAVLAVGRHRDGALIALAAWVLPLLVALPLAAHAVHYRLPARALRGAEAGDPRDAELAGAFWRATLPRALAATFEILIVWADVVLVAALIGATQAAVYAAASRFVTSGTFALQAVRLAVGPLLAGAFARGELAQASAVHRLSVRWAVLSTWPVFLALAAFAPQVLLVLGHGYTAAAPELTLLALAMLAVVATGNANTVLNMAQHSHWAALNTAAATGLMLGVDLVLVPRLGILGAAIGWSLAMLTDAGLGVLEVWFGLGLRSFDAGTVAAAVAVLGGFGFPAFAVRLIDATVLHGALPGEVLLPAGLLVAGCCYLIVLVRHRRELELDELRAALRRRPAVPAPRSPGSAT